MKRAIVSRKTLDALIRAKVAALDGCHQIEALPVTWRNGHRDGGCNWTIPGWVGDASLVERCVEQLGHYLAFLQEQFNIPPREASGE